MANLGSASSKNNTKKTAMRVAGKIPPQINRYYKTVSKVYRGIGIGLLLMMFVFFLTVTMFFSDYVTYENMRYLVRDFGAMMTSEGGGFTTIVYNGSEHMKFETFKNGLAAASGDRYLYYDASGICMIEEDSGCSEPVLVPADKYLLLYDLGGTGYSIYNQLTRIIRRDAEKRIQTADMSDQGAFILVTRSSETRYVVEVYNAAFQHTMSIYKENYVLDASISPDGRSILIASAIPENTDFSCEVSICKVGSSEAAVTLNYPHTMPLDTYATDEGFIVLCDTGLYFYDHDGNLVSNVDLSGMAITHANMTDASVAVAGDVNALGMESRVMVLSPMGDVLLDDVLENTRVTGVCASQNTDNALVYLETPEGFLQIRTDGENVPYEARNADVIALVPVKNGAIVCTKTSAYAAFVE